MDPRSPELVARRVAFAREVRDAAGAAAAGLDAGTVLGPRTDVRCTSGQDNWTVKDPCRSQCDATVTTAVPVRRPELRDLLGVQRRLNAAGWFGGAVIWQLTGGRGYLDDESVARGTAPFRIEDVAGASFRREDGSQVDASFLAADGSLPTPAPPVSTAGLYYAGYTEGTDWQNAASRAPTAHPYLLLVTGTATIGTQDRGPAPAVARRGPLAVTSGARRSRPHIRPRVRPAATSSSQVETSSCMITDFGPDLRRRRPLACTVRDELLGFRRG
jgi:hypothetical protein